LDAEEEIKEFQQQILREAHFIKLKTINRNRNVLAGTLIIGICLVVLIYLILNQKSKKSMGSWFKTQ
jgi:hypothetical protein